MFVDINTKNYESRAMFSQESLQFDSMLTMFAFPAFPPISLAKNPFFFSGFRPGIYPVDALSLAAPPALTSLEDFDMLALDCCPTLTKDEPTMVFDDSITGEKLTPATEKNT